MIVSLYRVFVICLATTSYIIVYPTAPSEPPSCEASSTTMYQHKDYLHTWQYLSCRVQVVAYVIEYRMVEYTQLHYSLQSMLQKTNTL